MKYFFQVGNHPKLAKSELEAVLRRENIDFEISFVIENIIVLETKITLEKNLLKLLGGFVKFGIIEFETTRNNLQKDIFQYLIKYNYEKIFFGLNNFTSENLKLNKIGLELKKELKNSNKNCRFVSGVENPLSSVIIHKNNLDKENGFDLNFISSADTILVGRTLAVQDYNFYSKIDYGRPAKDDLSGMLPPKVSQIMINLAEIKNNKLKVLDPFCGSGTILQMAALQGVINLIGYDNSVKAIKDTTENLDWLKKSFDLKFNLELETLGIENLEQKIKAGSIDVVVTEPYLGPAMRGSEGNDFVKKVQEELSQLYTKMFTQKEKYTNST